MLTADWQWYQLDSIDSFLAVGILLLVIIWKVWELILILLQIILLSMNNNYHYKFLAIIILPDACRSVGVSNFGVHHLEGLKAAGLPTPSVNQIQLHPFHQLPQIVEYCRNNGIVVMGYSPMAQSGKLGDPDLIRIAQRWVSWHDQRYKEFYLSLSSRVRNTAMEARFNAAASDQKSMSNAEPIIVAQPGFSLAEEEAETVFLLSAWAV